MLTSDSSGVCMASGCFCLYLWRLLLSSSKGIDFSFLFLLFARVFATPLRPVLPVSVQVCAVESLISTFSAAMTSVLAVSSAIRTKCTCVCDCLDLTGSQRRHYVQQLQDMQKLNDHHFQQQVLHIQREAKHWEWQLLSAHRQLVRKDDTIARLVRLLESATLSQHRWACSKKDLELQLSQATARTVRLEDGLHQGAFKVSHNLLREKDSLLAQQQEQLRNMKASLLKKSEEASSMQTQLRSARDHLQKQKQAFSQSAQMVSSLKLQLASGHPAQAKVAVQAPTPSGPTNSRLAVSAFDAFHSQLFQPGPEDDMDLLLPLETDKMVSEEFDRQYRSRYRQSTGGPLSEPVRWRRAVGSQAVRVPTVGGDMKLACLGQGKSGMVKYVEVLMADGKIAAGAAKMVSCQGKRAALAQAELEGLLAMQGKPYLVQCLAACSPVSSNGHQFLTIIMEYVEGHDLADGFKQLKLHLYPDANRDQRLFAATIWAIKQSLLAMASMHTQGWGHCDFKPEQVRVTLGESGKSFHSYKLVDAGSWTSFTGPFNERPVHLGVTPSFAAPEILLGLVVECSGVPCRLAIDAKAQDVFSLGCYVYNQLTRQHLFPIDTQDTIQNCLTDLCRQHWLWEATYDGAGATAVSPDVHPKLKLLRSSLADDAKYASVCGVLRRMLHPDLHSRCTISDVIASDLFVLPESRSC